MRIHEKTHTNFAAADADRTNLRAKLGPNSRIRIRARAADRFDVIAWDDKPAPAHKAKPSEQTKHDLRVAATKQKQAAHQAALAFLAFGAASQKAVQ